MKRDLVYFSPIPWSGLYQRPQHTARALAAARRVLFVEPRTLHAPPPPADEENLAWLTLPTLPVNARRPWLQHSARLLAQFALARDGLTRRQGVLLMRKLAQRGMSDPVLLFGHPEFAALLDLCPGCPLAYDHMDDILQFGRPPATLRRALARLARDAQVLSASAGALETQLRDLGARDVLRVGNGVEFERFRRQEPSPPEPRGLAALSRPRAIYVGSVAEWFDFDLLYAVAAALPRVSFPVVGPLRPALEVRRADAPPNVHFFGARPYAEVPAWLQHADAALIPFLRNELTAGVDPVKLHEYLAAELPVVATPFSDELTPLGERGAVTLAASAPDFAAGLERALAAPPDAAALRELAAARSWERVLGRWIVALDAL